MRILFVPQCLPPVLGGGEWHALRISECLAAEGHSVRTVTSNLLHVLDAGHRGAGVEFGPPHERSGGLEIIRHRYGSGFVRFLLRSRFSPLPGRGMARRYIRRGWNRDFERRVERELDTFQPDVVLTMAHLCQSVRVVYRIWQRRRFPLVYVPLTHVHDPLSRSAEMRAKFLGADAVVTNTCFEKAWLAREVGVEPERMFVGLLGTDPHEGPPAAPEHVLFLGRLTLEKGIDELLAAMELLWGAGHDHRLVLAGGRFRLTSRIDALLDALPPDSRARIELREDVSEAEKADLIRRAACVVLPSKQESFGLVLLEAWSHAVPVVAWDMPLFREIVTDGEDGLLARLEDAPDLARAIHALAGDPERRLALGARGRETLRTRFSWTEVAQRYVAACEHARRHPVSGCAR